jgi:hypothetical protein
MAAWHLSEIAADTSGLGGDLYRLDEIFRCLRTLAASAVHAAFVPGPCRCTLSHRLLYSVLDADETFASAELHVR